MPLHLRRASSRRTVATSARGHHGAVEQGGATVKRTLLRSVLVAGFAISVAETMDSARATSTVSFCRCCANVE